MGQLPNGTLAMVRLVVQHTRRHAIAYLALTCSLLALGGVAAAALQIPFGAGRRASDPQPGDRSALTWAPNDTTACLRRWAAISASGSIMSTSPGAQSKANGTGDVVVTWGDAFAGWCAPIATVLGGSATPPTTTTTTTSTTTSTTATSTTSTTPQQTPSGGAYADASIVTRT